jgi:soluble lytic murein transglycosylase-like protein
MDTLGYGLAALIALVAFGLASKKAAARTAPAAPGAAIPGGAPTVPFIGYIRRSAMTWGVPARLLAAIAKVESSFNPKAVNLEAAADARKGRDVDSIGLCQILYPDTALALDPEVTRDDLFDPSINLNLAGKLLAGLMRSYKGRDDEGFPAPAVAAYNAGQPRYTISGEFQNQLYVDRVNRAWRDYAGI